VAHRAAWRLRRVDRCATVSRTERACSPPEDAVKTHIILGSVGARMTVKRKKKMADLPVVRVTAELKETLQVMADAEGRSLFGQRPGLAAGPRARTAATSSGPPVSMPRRARPGAGRRCHGADDSPGRTPSATTVVSISYLSFSLWSSPRAVFPFESFNRTAASFESASSF
jgi:hypothetical protein